MKGDMYQAVINCSLCIVRIRIPRTNVEHSAGPVVVPLRDVLCVEIDDSGNKTVLHYNGANLLPICGVFLEQQTYRFKRQFYDSGRIRHGSDLDEVLPLNCLHGYTQCKRFSAQNAPKRDYIILKRQ